ncbi:hypothetical protein QYE76_064634 [Lolium multiflorum]|uniref:Uncharacterized protein n=1 Tax=Lolium multiflorum TaxID=4521 RepID=A0AAD8S776_LOLMU|nr:hypothetical protein QYE76_064634 [Lolium multiflorum]
MKVDTAPGSDGFPVAFFKRFWHLVKPLILDMTNGFALRRVDISRLNFGLRINFHKSVMVMGVEELKGIRIAHMLNCKQGTFPFIYLGLPVSDRALSSADWGPLMTKVGKNAEPWMGKMMSYAARLTLINACLSNLPLHAMAICLLGEGIHDTLDKNRSRFFWEANNTKRKYHWVRWSDMCKPKSLGGLG